MPRTVLLPTSLPVLQRGQWLPHTALLALLSYGYSALHSTTHNYLHYVTIPISLLSCRKAIYEALSLSSRDLGGTTEPFCDCTCNCEQKSARPAVPSPWRAPRAGTYPTTLICTPLWGNAAKFLCCLSPGCST